MAIFLSVLIAFILLSSPLKLFGFFSCLLVYFAEGMPKCMKAKNTHNIESLDKIKFQKTPCYLAKSGHMAKWVLTKTSKQSRWVAPEFK